ncbi:parasite-infected erythrocyte surface protein [Plasmodium gaboni]|uniref:Parasite-infected erythrocyte surface protein n=1 Tax=Plasmodium gaboni TaxID=647221 RepID=A0A151LSQ7_9APIC|nr:parasite-infected erythrocyte surface protein [Plasmodium gaboni]KYO02211.1 parasite-infected erythrocyte surface protein [Plasmodium gaboni]
MLLFFAKLVVFTFFFWLLKYGKTRSYNKSVHKGKSKINKPVVRTLAEFDQIFQNSKSSINFLEHLDDYKNADHTNNTYTKDQDEHSHELPNKHEDSYEYKNIHNSFNDKNVYRKEAFDQFLQTLLNNNENTHKEDESKESNQRTNKDGPSYENKKNMYKEILKGYYHVFFENDQNDTELNVHDNNEGHHKHQMVGQAVPEKKVQEKSKKPLFDSSPEVGHVLREDLWNKNDKKFSYLLDPNEYVSLEDKLLGSIYNYFEKNHNNLVKHLLQQIATYKYKYMELKEQYINEVIKHKKIYNKSIMAIFIASCVAVLGPVLLHMYENTPEEFFATILSFSISLGLHNLLLK